MESRIEIQIMLRCIRNLTHRIVFGFSSQYNKLRHVCLIAYHFYKIIKQTNILKSTTYLYM